MENLSIEKFNPQRAEIVALAEKHKGLEINGVDDTEGYALVQSARIELQKARVNITKTGKLLRDDAIKFQRTVIAYEKELIELIEPTERDLESKQEAVKEEKRRLERIASIPERRERLKAIETETTEDFLLTMDDGEFEVFFYGEKEKYLNAKQEAIEKQQRDLEEARERAQAAERAAEEEKQRLEDAEMERKQAVEQARLEAEADKQRAITEERERAEKVLQEERERAEREKQELITKQANAENERIAIEKKEAQAKEAKELAEKAEAEKLEKKSKYVKFLQKNGYTPDLEKSGELKIEWRDSTATLYKKLGSITL